MQFTRVFTIAAVVTTGLVSAAPVDKSTLNKGTAGLTEGSGDWHIKRTKRDYDNQGPGDWQTKRSDEEGGGDWHVKRNNVCLTLRIVCSPLLVH